MSGSATTESREALELHEGISLLEAASSSFVTRPDGTRIELGYDMNGDLKAGGVFDAQGRVPLHVIRPGIGKGRGRHLYEAAMLSRDAGKFTGWKMYANHLSPEAKKAANGLPRDVRDLGGRVQESWWDPTVPANVAAGHDAGGVMGMVRPVKFIRELIDDDPELVEASISAQATGVQPITRDGQRVWLVEGIRDRGSVDWVTEAGAGGRIAPLLQESYADEEDVQTALLESMSDDFLREHLKEHRPTFLQEAGTSTVEEAKDDKKGEDDEKVAELMKKGLPEAAARKAAAKALTETIETPGGDVAEITPEALADALKAHPTLIVEALTASGEGQVFITSLVEAKLEEERDTLRAESKADTDRAFELARMEREAHGLIRESKLPDSWQEALIGKFSIDEANAPAPALDVVAKVGEDGKVEKPAIEVLREAVTSEIDAERQKLREASTTRVRPPAAVLSETKATPAKGSDEPEDKKTVEEAQVGETPFWKSFLEENGIADPEAAYTAIQG
ncbi:MAG: hypothetical protein ABW167_20595 [Baekduia sp.]